TPSTPCSAGSSPVAAVSQAVTDVVGNVLVSVSTCACDQAARAAASLIPSSARTTTVPADRRASATTSGTIRSARTAAHDRAGERLLQPSNLGSSRRPRPYSAPRGEFLD